MTRCAMLLAVLFAAAAGAQQTTSKPGSNAPYAVSVQGVDGGKPLPISGSISTSGTADVVSAGAPTTFNNNSICTGQLLLAGEQGAGFQLNAGTLAATLQAQYSMETSGSNWTNTSFIDKDGSKSSTLVVTNPNALFQQGIVLVTGARRAQVCTTAFTSGSSTGFATAAFVQGGASSGGGGGSTDVTDRAGRLVGKVYGSDGNQLATANTGRLQVDVVTGGGSNGSVGSTGAAVPGSATYAGMNVAGNLTGLPGTANGLKTDGSAVTQPTAVADVTGSTATFNANAVCATVLMAGRTGARFVMTAGNLVGTLSTAVSGDATPSGNDCTGGTWSASRLFGDEYGNLIDQKGVSSSVFSLPLATGGAAKCVRVCTSIYTSGSSPGYLIATAQPASITYVGITTMNSASIDSNSGNKGQGTQRIVIATDQPQLTNPLKVDGSAVTQPVSGTVSATQGGAPWTQDLIRINGTTILTGNGATGAGSARFTIANDTAWLPDVADRAARLLGVVYGSQGQQLKQSATNFNAVAELAVGATLIDPRAIRALTSGDVVTTAPPANASTDVTRFGGSAVVTGTGAGGAGIPRVTVSSDSSVGLNAGANIIGKVGIDQTTPGTTNGVQVVAALPAGGNTIGNVGQAGAPWSENTTQLGGNAINTGAGTAGTGTARVAIATDANGVKVTDGTNTAAVKAASTAAVAADPAVVAALSPNTPLPAGMNLLGGTQIVDGQYGAIEANVKAGSTTPLASDPALNVTLSPNSAPLKMQLVLSSPPSGPKGATPTYSILSQVQQVDENGHIAAIKAPLKPPTANDQAQVVTPSPIPAPVCTAVAAISQTASARLVVGVGPKRIYICSVFVVSASAQSIALTEGTGTTCGTLPVALAGSTTVANGMALAANGGWTQTAGTPFMVTQKDGDDLCLLQSGAGNVSGSISYVLF